MTNVLLKNAKVFLDNEFVKTDLLIENGLISKIEKGIFALENTQIIDCENYYISPGFADVHVHFREPGFLYKETIETGSKAAAKGGFTLVATMPNLNPVPDSKENLQVQLNAIKKDAVITVIPYGAITIGEKGKELINFSEIANDVLGFSDDGKGVQSDEMMKEAMLKAKDLDKFIVAHCEDESLLDGGYIHKGEYAKKNNHKGISSQSEYKQVERDINLVRETGVKYHICHISTKETVDLVRKAKAEGLPVSCETAPHYLAFSDMDLKEDGIWKMNPPIRSNEDRKALIEGVIDGTIEVIATDHAPHSKEEKEKGLAGSAFGIVGIENSFGAMYTYMVLKNHISLEKLIDLMSIRPRTLFGLKSGINIGDTADLAVLDLNAKQIVDPETFISKGFATPFTGKELSGDVVLTIAGGKIVWQKNSQKK